MTTTKTATTKTTYKPWREVDFRTVRFEQRMLNGKWRIEVVKPTLRCITPAMRTNWPKLGKDADIGTNYGPGNAAGLRNERAGQDEAAGRVHYRRAERGDGADACKCPCSP